MPTLTELRETFFSDRPVTQIFFGEPEGRPIMDTVLRRNKIVPIDADAFDDSLIRQLAAGTYPVLIQWYDGFRFDTVVPEDRLRDYLREHMDRPDPRVSISFASREVQAGIVQSFLELTGKRTFKILPVGADLKLYLFTNKGDRLVVATLGRAPVPGDPILA